MRRFAVDVVGSGGPGLTRRPPADDGAAGPAAVALTRSAAPNPVPLQFNSAGVTGPRAKPQGPHQSAGDNDDADEQPAHSHAGWPSAACVPNRIMGLLSRPRPIPLGLFG